MAIELMLFVGPDGPKKRRVQLRSDSMRSLCIKAEELIRKSYNEGHIAWLCTPPVIHDLNAKQRVLVSERIKFYLANVTQELDTENLVLTAINGPEGPIRSAA